MRPQAWKRESTGRQRGAQANLKQRNCSLDLKELLSPLAWTWAEASASASLFGALLSKTLCPPDHIHATGRSIEEGFEAEEFEPKVSEHSLHNFVTDTSLRVVALPAAS